jgi:hypothetical protein
MIIKIRVNPGRGIMIRKQGHDLQHKWQHSGFDSAFAPAGAVGVREENCVADPKRITIFNLGSGARIYAPHNICGTSVCAKASTCPKAKARIYPKATACKNAISAKELYA